MKTSKKAGKITKVTVFLILLLLILTFFSCITVPGVTSRIPQKDWIDPRDLGAAGIFSEKKNTIDLIVVGDSESFTAFSPYRLWEKQRITSYVCGQSAQHTAEAYYLLKQALRLQHPKLVILETDELFADGLRQGSVFVTRERGERSVEIECTENTRTDDPVDLHSALI